MGAELEASRVPAICGRSGFVSKAAPAMGLAVMPPIELSDSAHFGLANPRLIEWLCFMLEKGKLRSIMLEPPCTTFSPAAHPAVRSYKQPLGFCLTCPKTKLGNLLAFRGFLLSWLLNGLGGQIFWSSLSCRRWSGFRYEPLSKQGALSSLQLVHMLLDQCTSRSSGC